MKNAIFLIAFITVSLTTSANQPTVTYPPIPNDQRQKSQVSPSKYITPFNEPELIGSDLSIVEARPAEQKGDYRFGIELKAFSIQNWFYHEMSALFLKNYLEVVSPIQTRRKYKDIILSYQGGLQANFRRFVIPYMSIGPALVLRQEKQVTCRKNEYCFAELGTYKEEKESYYTRISWGAKAGIKTRIRGLEMDFSNFYLALPRESITGFQIGFGISF